MELGLEIFIVNNYFSRKNRFLSLFRILFPYLLYLLAYLFHSLCSTIKFNQMTIKNKQQQQQPHKNMEHSIVCTKLECTTSFSLEMVTQMYLFAIVGQFPPNILLYSLLVYLTIGLNCCIWSMHI